MVLLCVICRCVAFAHAEESTLTAAPVTSGAAADSATVVYVSANRGELRSGPADEFYPTDYLPRGTSLEVHHRTDDHWLGVRPPEGSFSWVPAADAYLLPGGKLIEITSAAAVSWIGTSLGSAKQYRWQVKLKPGEQLAVRGEQSTKGSDGKEVLWYKIAPPSGEFRWIHAKTVSSKPIPVNNTASKQHPPSQSKVQTAALTNASTATNRPANGKPANRKSTQKPSVVSAAYQEGETDGVIVLGSGDDYYDGGPMEGDIIYEGEGFAGPMIEGEVFAEGYVDGGYGDSEYIHDGYVNEGYAVEGYEDGSYIDGGYGDEGYVDGQIIDGEIIYENGSYIDGGYMGGSNDHFAGWHAMDLGDDGMRLTWLERLYTRARQRGPDPLAADPFDLSMARGTVRPNSEAAYAQMAMAGDLYEPTGPTNVQRRQRGWRDPRTLRENRSGFSSVPITAPEFSSSDGPSMATQGLASNLPPIASGLDRVAGALASARTALSESTLLAAQTASTEVNWYGISSGSSPATTATATSAASLDLSQLQVALGEMVTQPMQLWNLQSVYDSAKYYVEHGGSPIERGQARLLMERIEEFAELAQRSGYLALNRTTVAIPNFNPGSSVMMAGASSANTAANVVSSDFQRDFSGAANYDATGWLVPVIATSPGQPTHALTDETGRILSYITAIPGLNLDRYVNQAVGVTGLRGYLPQLQSGHIQAQRVVRVQ